MKKSGSWTFVKKAPRPNLDGPEARKLRRDLAKTLKIGIELEYNLPKLAGLCKKDNPACACISKFTLSNGVICEDTCSQHGNCELEKSSGCPDRDIFCVGFVPLCATCDKADKGCSTCDKLWAPEKEPENIRKAVAEKLSPTKFLGSAGKCGVLDIVRDGSLSGDGGLEVVTVGQRVSFANMYSMCEKIVAVSKDHGAFVDERTSIHFHILSGYLSTAKYNPKRPHYGLPGEMAISKSRGSYPGSREVTEQQRNSFEIVDLEHHVPEIVLANFHQLWRRFENAFIWLTSTGDSPRTLTRWAKFRRSLLKYSALRESMPVVMDQIARNMENNRRYAMVNYSLVKFSGKTGAIKRLHFEVRASDGCLSPAAVAAQACLLHALLLKSVDLSRHGILKSGSSSYMSLAHEISDVLCNNCGEWGGPRTSDTSRLDPYIGTLVEQATELVVLCKSFLVDDVPAYDILLNLAKRPVSVRRCNGKSWEEIETELLPPDSNIMRSSKIVEAIDTASFTECDSPEQWEACVSEDCDIRREVVAIEIKKLTENGQAFWNPSLGSFCRR